MINALLTLLRTRKDTVMQLLALAGQPLRRTRRGKPPIATLRVACRILRGFTPPLAESAAVVTALRAAGWPAQLVVGAEPLPASNGERPVHVWIDVGGRAEGTVLPADALLTGFARFPERAASRSTDAATPPAP
jgi:hypothetical protein